MIISNHLEHQLLLPIRAWHQSEAEEALDAKLEDHDLVC